MLGITFDVYTPDITTPVVSDRFEFPLLSFFFVDAGIRLIMAAICSLLRRYGSPPECAGEASLFHPPISSNVAEFAKQFNNEVFVSEAIPCAIYLSADRQQYDLMLVYLDKDKPFVLFIDFKSKQILDPSVSEKDHAVQFTPDFEQFRNVQSAVIELGAMGGKEKLSPVSQALVDGNYAFVCATTYPNVNKSDDSKVYVANDSEMMKFMPLLKPFYGISKLDPNH